MEQPLDVSIVLTETSPDSSPEVLASIALHCEALSLSHLGNMLIDPLTQRERDDMRWYLEEYWKWPYLEFAVRGKQTEALLIDVGKRLYQAVFGSVEAQTIIQEWQKQPEARHQISIVSEIPRVLSLPWELLHDAHGFLALRPEHPITIVRRLPLREQSLLSIPFEAPLRILLVTARPENAGFIDPRSVAHILVDEIQTQVEAGTIDLEFLRPPTLAALHARLSDRERPIHILHFDGHGAFDEARYKQGLLLFETKTGWPSPVRASDLAKVLGDSGIRLVVLTACQSAVSATDDAFSSVAAQLMQNGVDAVVAMSGSILVASATLYVEAFYRELAAGIPVSGVQERARQALHDNPRRHIHRRRRNDDGIPVELRDWWLPHFYQQRPLLMQPTKSIRQRNKRQGTLHSSSLSENMPSEPRYGFSGRTRALLQLERWLIQEKLVVVSGFGGIGKTALVREAADWLTRTKMYEKAYFVSFEHGGNATSLLSILGTHLEINDGRYKPSDYPIALARLKAMQKEKHRLLIVDNLESILQGGEAPLEVTALAHLWDVLLELAKMGFGVLLTSRDPSLGNKQLTSGNRVAHLTLGSLQPDDAYAFASRVLDDLGIDRKEVPYADLRDLLTQLDHHPLAIQLVLPALRELSLLTIQANFVELLPQFVDDTAIGHNRSLLASLDYSLRRLSEEAQTFLPHLAIFNGGALEPHLLDITRIPEREWTKFRQALEEAGLLTVEWVYKDLGVPPFIHFHPVLNPFLHSQNKAGNGALLANYVRHYSFFASKMSGDVNYNSAKARALVELEFPNLRRTLDLYLAIGKQEIAMVLTEVLIKFLNLSGLEAERDALRRLLAQNETVTLPHVELNLQEYLRMIGMADDEYRKGNLSHATDQYKTLLALIEAQPEGIDLGYGSFAHSNVLLSLSRCLRRGGQSTTAASLIEKGLTIADAKLKNGPDASDFRDFMRARSLHLTEMGHVLIDLGQYLQAQNMYQEGLNTATQLGDSRQQTVILEGLGVLASRQRNYAEARSHFSQVLETCKILGGDPEVEANAWHNLGLVAQSLQQWLEAEQCYRESLIIKDQLGNATSIAATYYQLAQVTLASGHHSETEGWFKRALDLIELAQANSSMHATLLYSLAQLLVKEAGVSHTPMSNLTEAKSYVERALEIQETLDVSQVNWKILNLLADITNLEGQAEAARDYRRRAREAFSTFAGHRHAINYHFGRIMYGITIATLGDTEMQIQVEEALPELEVNLQEQGIVKAIHRIWEGERDWHILSENLGLQSALLVLRVLETLATIDEHGVVLLPINILESFKYDDSNAFEQAFEILSHEEKEKMIKVFNCLNSLLVSTEHKVDESVDII